MKRVVLYIIVLNLHLVYSQDKNEILEMIKDKVEIVDSYTEAETFSLNPEEFLDKITDNGAELIGYYEHDRLKKIVRKVGQRTAEVVTSYYFSNDQLVYVSYKQNPYKETKNENGQRIIDYSNTYTKYESKHYFNMGERIHKETVGSVVKGISAEEKFLNYIQKMKALLDNKFYNKDVYESLQGKWLFIENTEDYMKFDGTMRFNFYNGRFANRQKTRIEDGILICSLPMDDRIYQYKILELTDTLLVLLDLSSSEEFSYAKVDY